MEGFEKITWSAPEYEKRNRGSDWFWALGVIIITATVAAAMFGNYFFAGLIAIAGGILYIFEIKQPEIVNFEINSTGIKVREQTYPFKGIVSFWIDPNHRHTLFIKSQRLFLPILTIPIHPDDAEDIHAIFVGQNIPKEEMREHISEKILETFGL